MKIAGGSRRGDSRKKCGRKKRLRRLRLGRKGGAASCAKRRGAARRRKGKMMIFMGSSARPRPCAAAGLTTMESCARQLGKRKIKGS